uniref:Programmed cell death protein 5 n=1 Tax=Globodera rostochiensis TaxID=31243 RepID=A0A914HIT4_GLORO
MQEDALSAREDHFKQGPVNNDNKAEEAAKRQADQEFAKNSILTQIIDKSGMARLSNLRAAKPEKARAVEGMLIDMARSGRIRGKLSDSELRTLLDRVSAAGATKSTKVKYDRRRAAIDSDGESDTPDKKDGGESSSSDD